jgi:transcriptional regulator with XRE-family HTH domain
MSDKYKPVRRQTADFQDECRLLSKQIDAWRIYRGMSQRKLHQLSDVPVSRFIELRKTGRADPKFTTILRIARALDVTIPELLYRDPGPLVLPEASD